jgi:hypothetical protein
MDLSRPLWEMYLVGGLENFPGLPPQCQALVAKFHHAAVDGVTLAGMIAAMHGLGATATQTRAAPEPDYWDIWARMNLRNLGRQYKLAETLGNLLPRVMRARQIRGEFGDLPPILGTRAHFNERVAAGRTVGALVWPRAEFLAIKRAVRRVTLNDIATSVVGGALRQYLREKQRLPDTSLVAGVPVSLRGADVDRVGGNQIATVRVGLGTAEPDPVARLRLVHRYAVAGKKQIDALGTGTVMDISD